MNVSGIVAEENKRSMAEGAGVTRLEPENTPLKREARLEEADRPRLIEAALAATPAPAEVGLPSCSLSSASSSSPLLHPSSPLLAFPRAKGLGEVEQLLQHVAYGEQKEAEILIQRKPDLLLCKGNVRDLSHREFQEITAFQYAVWALDWHMWKMILKYMKLSDAAVQWQEWEDAKEHPYEKQASWQTLIDALNGCVKKYMMKKYRSGVGVDLNAKKYSRWGWDQFYEYLIAEVGGAQRLLPAHVVNEYCQPDRGFERVPDFKLEKLVRVRIGQLYDGTAWLKQDWYTGKSTYYQSGKYKDGLGTGFAFVRGVMEGVLSWGAVGGTDLEWGIPQCAKDCKALQALKEVREAQIEELRSELSCYLAGSSLESRLPSPLLGLVLGYLR